MTGTDQAIQAFQRLAHRKPYSWQRRLLAEWLIEGRIPDAVDVPTGLGKTAIIALWLAARTIGAPLPRRLVYVVDRRAVVDQATEEAERLAQELGDGSNIDSDLARWRARLGLVAGRLPVSTLRGQFADNRAWLDAPATSAIIVGTVDMIGSRLLFEGYGVGPRMRPVHAGLLGVDTLVVLDEAHLVPPFEALVRQVGELRVADDGAGRRWAIPGFWVMALSATGRTMGSNVFSLEPADDEDPAVRARLHASKRLRLHETPAADLAERMADHAIALSERNPRVIIFCDSRKAAQAVQAALDKDKRLANQTGAPKTELLVGARRVREREALKASELFRRFDPNSGPGDGATAFDGPVFLIATSAGEVGVDLDADHMVCDLVAWERMVQRLGRVNRRPCPGEALVEVIVAAPDERAKDPAGTERLASFRAPFESTSWPIAADGRREASPASLRALKENSEFAALVAAATSAEPLRPELTRAVVDAWSMTAQPDHPGRPDIEPWLRGWVPERPQTRIVWRRHLPIHPDDDVSIWTVASKEFFERAAPHLSEVLETETDAVAELLKARAASLLKSPKGDKNDAVPADASKLILVPLNARGEVEKPLTLAELAELRTERLKTALAGRTVVVDARIGGLSRAGLLDPKADHLPPTLDGDPADDDGWDERRLEAAEFRVRRVEHDALPAEGWRVEYRWPLISTDDVSSEADLAHVVEVRVEVFRKAGATKGDPALAGEAQRLAGRHAWTEGHADMLAGRLGLPDELRRMLAAAAAVHDAGKTVELWQRAMGAPQDGGGPYAKTCGGGNPRLLEIDGQIYRHEFGSLRIAADDPAIRALPDDLQELALHLIVAHHGYARPVIAPVHPDMPPSLAADLAQAAALRSARLQRQWGAWGLAWWEALLRAADWAASRQLNEAGRAN